MPKTRSGKIMRRVIAATSNFTDVGDITTLANPEIVEQIRHQVQNAKHARGEVPRELTEAERPRSSRSARRANSAGVRRAAVVNGGPPHVFVFGRYGPWF